MAPSEPESAPLERAHAVARIACIGDDTEVETPVVAVRADGVHLVVNSDADSPAISIQSERGFSATVGFAEAGPANEILLIPPGSATVECGQHDEPSVSAKEITFVDPNGMWHDTQLSCSDFAQVEQRAATLFFTKENPLLDALRRIFPGILPDDEVSYGGFPGTRRRSRCIAS